MNTNKDQVPQCDKTAVMQSVIKGQHLRIGNLLYFNGNHKEIGVVSEIFKNDLTKVAPYKIGINHRIDIYYDIDKLKPIPLVKKWLLKSGFEYDKETYIFKKGDIRIEFIDKEFVFNYFFGIVYLKYVHQLQNLYFYLTEDELTVA